MFKIPVNQKIYIFFNEIHGKKYSNINNNSKGEMGRGEGGGGCCFSACFIHPILHERL